MCVQILGHFNYLLLALCLSLHFHPMSMSCLAVGPCLPILSVRPSSVFIHLCSRLRHPVQPSLSQSLLIVGEWGGGKKKSGSVDETVFHARRASGHFFYFWWVSQTRFPFFCHQNNNLLRAGRILKSLNGLTQRTKNKFLNSFFG